MIKATDYKEILPTGKENAISSKDLAVMLGFDSVRSLQADIARAREAGQVILSCSSGGYYLPANTAEITEFVAVLKSRALNTLKAMRSAKLAIKEAECRETGQMHFEDIKKDFAELAEALEA